MKFNNQTKINKYFIGWWELLLILEMEGTLDITSAILKSENNGICLMMKKFKRLMIICFNLFGVIKE